MEIALDCIIALSYPAGTIQEPKQLRTSIPTFSRLNSHTDSQLFSSTLQQIFRLWNPGCRVLPGLHKTYMLFPLCLETGVQSNKAVPRTGGRREDLLTFKISDHYAQPRPKETIIYNYPLWLQTRDLTGPLQLLGTYSSNCVTTLLRALSSLIPAFTGFSNFVCPV